MSMKKVFAVVLVVSFAAIPALAANPFSDVPKNHWAYDAVERLAAKGILEGYPNGTFKGNRAMTRYEIAQMVARLMANGGSGDELTKLIEEFAPELRSLGVRADGFDDRLTRIEKNLGSWRISGEMRFDYNAFKKDFKAFGDDAPRHGFVFDKARLFLHKELSDGVTFDAEYGDGVFDRWWVTAEDFLGWGGLTFKAGQFDIDFEGDDGLYYEEHEDHGLFMGLPYRGVQLTQNFGLGEITAFAASNLGDDGIAIYEPNEGGEYYGLRLKFNFSERLWLSGNYYVSKPGEHAEVGVDDFKVWWIGVGFKFGSGIELKGAYYKQDFDESHTSYLGNDIDDAKGWKAILNVDQDVLRFTSLWVEYGKFDEGLTTENLPYAFHKSLGDWYALGVGDIVFPVDTKVLFVALKQQWNEKWSTFERYVHYDFDSSFDKVKDWAVGVGYQYTPNLYFELAYNRIDTGDNVPRLSGYDFREGDIIRFRTLLSF